jgi:hypothetical protein
MAIDGSDQPREYRSGRLDRGLDRDIDHHEAQKEKDEGKKRKGRRST